MLRKAPKALLFCCKNIPTSFSFRAVVAGHPPHRFNDTAPTNHISQDHSSTLMYASKLSYECINTALSCEQQVGIENHVAYLQRLPHCMIVFGTVVLARKLKQSTRSTLRTLGLNALPFLLWLTRAAPACFSLTSELTVTPALSECTFPRLLCVV